MSKYKPGDRFILEITEIDQEAFLRGYPHHTYLIKGMDGAFSENVLDKLERVEPKTERIEPKTERIEPKTERIEPKTVLTNADNIRNMSLEDLAAVIMCPYDTAGDPKEIMPCIQEGEDPEFTKKCLECCKAWLQKEVSSGKA